jgi:hypothetical protein
MKRKNQNPRDYSYGHTKQRMRERYDLPLSPVEYDRLCNVLRITVAKESPAHILINTEGEQLTFLTKYRGHQIAAVWDKQRDLVTTVLPATVVADHLHI